MPSERKSFTPGRGSSGGGWEKCVFRELERFILFCTILFARDEPRGAIHFFARALSNLESFLISEAHFKLISRLSDTLPLTRLNTDRSLRGGTERGKVLTKKRGQLQIIRRKWKTARVEISVRNSDFAFGKLNYGILGVFGRTLHTLNGVGAVPIFKFNFH